MKAKPNNHAAAHKSFAYVIQYFLKLRAIIVFSLLFTVVSTVYAQEPESHEGISESNDFSETERGGKEAGRFSDFPVRISTFTIESQYYGFPLSIKAGWLYRQEDFSIFPHAGLSFTDEGGLALNTVAGFSLRNGNFFYDAHACYALLPFTMTKKAEEQIVYGTSTIGFTAAHMRISFPFTAGRQKKIEIGTKEASAREPVRTARVVTSFSSGIQLDFFLADYGFFKTTATAAAAYHWIPQDNFRYYTLNFNIPATFYLYAADIAFMYSLFHTGTVQTGSTAPLRCYEIEKPQHAITRRLSFKSASKYSQLHIFGTEWRYYPIRFSVPSNGFFISAFLDTGIGIKAQKKYSFLWECGGGIGYALYNTVPFTFQVGINQDKQPVFFLSVVSRLSHRP